MPWRGVPVMAALATYKRPELARRCVESLRPHVDDVIVVEGVSPAFVARNRAIERVPDDAIVFLVDDDCYYDASLRLDRSLPFLTHAVGVIQVAQKPAGSTWLEPPDPGRIWSHPFHWLAGGFLFRRRTWLEVGMVPDEIQDDVAFTMAHYVRGYTNLSSTLSWGFHDAGTCEGGMFASEVFAASDVSRWGLSGKTYAKPWGQVAMGTDHIASTAHRQHDDERRRRFGDVQPWFEGEPCTLVSR